MQQTVAATRTLDDLGRIVIPKEIRQALNWGQGTELDIEIQDITVKAVLIRQSKPHCALCGQASAELMPVRGGFVCPKCRTEIAAMQNG